MAADDLLTNIRAEIDARMRELRPLLAEYEELLSVADALAPDGDTAPEPAPVRAPAKVKARPKAARPAPKRERAPHSPTGQAIVAALEHGSHTVAELVVVTALPAADIRDCLRHLRRQRAIVKTDRDGRTAYALSAPA